MLEKLEWGKWYRDRETGQTYRHCPLHVGQQAIWDSSARFLAMICGKFGAKSSFAPLWLDREIRKNPTGQFILCAPNTKSLDQGLMPHFLRHMEHNDLKGNLKEQKGVYELSTGGIVFLRSLDDPESSINAIHANAIVVDEAGNVPMSTWTVIESRVAGTLGRVLLTTTPYQRFNWLQSEIISRWQSGDPNYFVFQGPSTINPAQSGEEFERLRKIKSPHIFARDYLGLFTRAEGCVYPGILDCLIDMPADGIPDGTYYGSIDWGHGGHDPTAALVGVLDHKDILWVFWERYVAKEDIEQTAIGLKEFHNGFYMSTGRTVSRWAADHNPGSIKYVKNYRLKPKDNHDREDTLPRLNVVKATKGPGSIEHGIDLVNARIRTGRLKIIRGPVAMLQIEGDSYRYDVDEEGNGNGKPKGADHSLDALRYMVSMIYQKHRK